MDIIESSQRAMTGSDYFAELYVAGVLARRGWNVYFPHRDEGFDFIISKLIDGEMLIRPVQVKGKYPEPSKNDKIVYGYVGKLSQFHPEMILAIPYFPVLIKNSHPTCIAYMPSGQVKRHARGYRCEPAGFRNRTPEPRRDYAGFFDDHGLELLEMKNFKDLTIAPAL
jgi:hypothetical protein